MTSKLPEQSIAFKTFLDKILSMPGQNALSDGKRPTLGEIEHCERFRRCLSNDQAVRLIKNGISFEVIAPLSDYFGMGKGEIYTILDFDRTTAMRRANKDQPLPKHVAENVLRLLELQQLACDTFVTEEESIAWLRRPHPMLEGESPLLAANTSFGTRRVKDILIAIQHGGVV